MTHYVDSMPIASIGGILCDVLFNPKYAGCVYKVTVAIDSLGNIVWICPLAPGASADVLIWDREGPKRSKGRYIDYEIGSMDGAYKGRLHVAWPFIGRKDQKDSCVFLRVATNALFMAFPDVHDVCYVQGRWFATFLSWGSLGHLILRAFPKGVLGGSSGGT